MAELPLSGGKPQKQFAVSINAVWDRLEARLESVNHSAWRALRPGTTENRLAAFGQRLSTPLPADLYASLLRHDGQEDEGDSLFPRGFGRGWNNDHFILMPTAVIEQHWEEWKESLESGAFDGNKVAPDVGVRGRWWSVGWVPFACDHAGSYLCVDTDPAEGGVVGQILDVRHDDGDRRRLAYSLTELLTDLCDHYERRPNG